MNIPVIWNSVLPGIVHIKVCTVSPLFFGLIQTGSCQESEKVRTLKSEYSTVQYCTVNIQYCLAHILIDYNMVQYAYTVLYERVKYGYTCNRVQYNINPNTAVRLLEAYFLNRHHKVSLFRISLKLLLFFFIVIE